MRNGPVIIAVNPGSLLASKMVKKAFGIAGNDLQIGANIRCRLACDADFATSTGKYWDNDAAGYSAVQVGGLQSVMNTIKWMVQ